MGKRRKLRRSLPSTSKAGAREPGPGNGGGSSNEGPDDASSLNPTTGSGNGGQGMNHAPEAELKPKGLHPLYMPEILTHIFHFCPPEVLPSIRLVSKAWEEESLKLWRSSATLQFHYSEKDDIFLCSGNGTEDDLDLEPNKVKVKTPLVEFMKFWKATCGGKPFQRFHLSDWEFALLTKNKTTKGQMTTKFWNLVGSHMTTLKLSDCDFSSAKVLRKIIFQACPNLQELTLDGCSYRNTYDLTMTFNEPEYQGPQHGEQVNLQSLSICVERRVSEKTPFLSVSWLEILSHFPGLKSLTLTLNMGFKYTYYWQLLEELLKAIKLIRAHDGVSKLPIQQIRIAFDSEMEHIESIDNDDNNQVVAGLIRELGLPLELDVLRLNLSQDDIGGARHLISTSKEVLRKLVAREEFRVLNDNVWGFPFGIELPNLEELTMSHKFCGSMEFLKYTPNLTDLQIFGDRTGLGNGGRGSLETELVSHTFQPELAELKLLKLKVLYFEFQLTEGDLLRLIDWLPNVENLSTYLNDSQFGVVCDNWRKLEHLHVLGGKLTDVGITGRMSQQLPGGLMTAWIIPNITYLQGLTCFRVCFGGTESEFSDAAAFNGFLKLPDLRFLDLSSARNSFGERALDDLRSKISICIFNGFHPD